MDICLEIFGYIGTALVVISMLMTSVVRLRVINMCGGIISAIYSVFYNAWPIVVMNVILIVINFFQVVIYYRGNGGLRLVQTDGRDSSLRHFISINGNKICSTAVDDIMNAKDDGKYLVFSGGEIVGFVVADLSTCTPVVKSYYVSGKYGYSELKRLLKSDSAKV